MVETEVQKKVCVWEGLFQLITVEIRIHPQRPQFYTRQVPKYDIHSKISYILLGYTEKIEKLQQIDSQSGKL
jgi:hypothetical protein